MTRRMGPALLRSFDRTDVTVCIPAYQAARFIDRTLHCAMGQTHPHLRILISVDTSSDDTAAICRRFAQSDRRIEVIEQTERQGWCGNVNALLERVETPFFFIYFHDDLILPQYVAYLRRALLDAPEAASVHCDLAFFGSSEAVKRGHAYTGSAAQRILTLWGVEERGTPLRSMVRREKVGPAYRLPKEGPTFSTGEPLLVRLMAAGPALHVPETLYLRWFRRKEGLTDSWAHMGLAEFTAGWQADAALAASIIDEQIADQADRAVLKFVLGTMILNKLIGRYRAAKKPLPDLGDLHPDFAGLTLSDDLARFGAEIAEYVRQVSATIEEQRASSG